MKLFGTDGVRGIANEPPMTVEMAMKLGQGMAYVLKAVKGRRKVIIGKDTRVSGYMIENAITGGICSMGVDALLVGPMPTPAIAFLTRSMRCDAGVVISASHNTFEYNGIKVFSRDGFKLPDELEARIEDYVLSTDVAQGGPTAGEVGKAARIDDARGRYIVFLKNTFPDDLTLDGTHMVMDCAHGATYKVAPMVMDELGAKLTVVGDEPDGTNINLDCGSLYPHHVAAMVKHRGADLGMAFDGDGDRLILIDEQGQVVDGDKVMGVIATWLFEQGLLGGGTVVATVMSNLGLEVALKRRGIGLVRAPVGDRYVVEEMRRLNCNFGGEQSGHLIFLDHNTTGDGILSALQMLMVMQRTGKRLSELASLVETYPQVLLNVEVREKRPIEEVAPVVSAMEKVETELGDRGRLLVRYSGTEPLLRVMIEGDDGDKIALLAEDVAEAVRRELG